jgi:hypothetical protein
MQEQCFFNRKSEIQIGFPELERINRIKLSEGEISKQISLKEKDYSFNVICLKGVCALYLNSEKEDLELQKIEAIIFEQEVLYSRNLDHDKYYIRNRGEGETLVLILKIRA